MRVLIGTMAVLALMGATGAQAQGYLPYPYAAPAPVYVNPSPYYAAPPVIVAPAPSAIYVAPGYGYGYGYGYGGPNIVDYRTGRWCRIEENGYRFCWTP